MERVSALPSIVHLISSDAGIRVGRKRSPPLTSVF